ncbi:MAG: 5-formyltetrahydrofolate cyclo-ligase [Rickettsiales bacterium]|nr:5-formyltetrahydrofolate cyclo-ligase [Rickettsiales bacterium]
MSGAPPTKAALRSHLLARRDLVSLALQENFALQQRDHALEALTFKGVVAGYRSIRREADPSPLMQVLYDRKIALALPCLLDDKKMMFRQWTPGDPLRLNALNIEEPLPQAPEVMPDMLIMPLVAFDLSGQRLGYGKGYYDRLFANPAYERARRIGYAYEFQKLERLPSEPHDATLDYVATEAAFYRFLD